MSQAELRLQVGQLQHDMWASFVANVALTTVLFIVSMVYTAVRNDFILSVLEQQVNATVVFAPRLGNAKV
jgi:hypothetical protein